MSTIITRNSATPGNTPSAASLQTGELAINVTDSRLFYGSGSVVKEFTATAFPYTGSAIISGSLTVTGSVNITGSTTHVGNIIMTGSLLVTQSHISTVDYIDFTTGSDQTMIAGRLGWNDSDGTLDIGLKGGNVNLLVGESEVAYVYNAEATTLNKGEVVFITGSQGNRVAVKRAFATTDPTSAGTLGFVAETITAGSTGFVITSGVLNKLNTVTYSEGALLYLSSSAGQYTTTPPTPPLHSVRLGYVQRSHATVGSIYVKIDNGYELGELHDIIDNTTTSSYGDLLVKSGSVWINSKQLTGSYGLTGSLTISGSLTTNDGVNIQTLTASIVSASSGITGSLFGTATTASYVTGSIFTNANSAASASYAATAALAPNYVLNSATSSMLAPYVLNSQTSSFVLNSQTSSMLAPYVLNSQTSSFVLNSQTSSFVLNSQTSSFVLNSQTSSMLAPYVLNSQTSSFVLNSQTASMTAGTASRVTGGTANYIPLWSTATSLATSSLYQSGSSIGLGTLSPNTNLHISASSAQPLLNIENALTTGYSNMRFTGTGKKFVIGVGNASETTFGIANDFFIYDDSVGAMRMIVDTSGNIGIGTVTTGTEANLHLGAKGTVEGGQIILQKATNYTSASHLDNFQDTFRIIRGNDTTSGPGGTADLVVNHVNGQLQLPKYTSATSLTGTSTSVLGTDSSGNVLTMGGWTDYSGTSTIVGFSSYTSKVIQYMVMSKILFVSFDLRSATNAGSGSAVSFTLPNTAIAGGQQVGTLRIQNSTTQTIGTYVLSASSNVMNFYTSANASTGTWTDATTRHIQGFAIINIV